MIMKIRLLLTAVYLWLAIGTFAQGADYSKMSTLVRRAVLSGESKALSRGASPSLGARITAFVRINRGETDAVMARYHCRKYAQWGDIAIASIPLKSLSAMSRESVVSRIEAGMSCTLQMDTTVRLTDILPVYDTTPTHQAFTGKGVVVGVMDVGFDLTHPSFYDVTGTEYRVGAFWDQLLKAGDEDPLPVGQSFVGQQAVLAQGHSLDGDSQAHGTHTLGIAAGSGHGSPYRGVAWESDICLVSNAVSSDIKYIDPDDLYKYTTATDALGFKYLFDYAEANHRPCVASFSEGYSPYLDTEDSLYSAVLDSLTGPGRIIVASAGNESSSLTYVDKPVDVTSAGAFISTTQSAALYRIRTDGEMTLRVHLYQGTKGTPSHTLTFTSDDARWEELENLEDTFFVEKDTCAVLVYRYPSSFMEQTVYLIEIHSNKALNKWSAIALEIAGASHTELYGSRTYALASRSEDSRWNAATKGHNILAPGCFPPVICVGATSHRLRVKNYKGQWMSYGGANDGRVASYSSTGPAFNGLLKPEVMAPGTNVVSAYSAWYLEQNPTKDSEVIMFSTFGDKDYPWSMNSGTSMSTPVVAGTIALWLEANPNLTPEEVLGVISRSSRQPEEGIYPNDLYGFGEINGYKGLLEVLDITGIEGVSLSEATDVQVVPSSGGLRLQFSEPHAQPVRVRVFALTGALLADTRVSGSSAFVSLRQPSGTVCVVQIGEGSGRDSGSRLVRF